MELDLSRRSWQLTLAAALLVIFAAQAALGSPANSAALDEEYHLAPGYAYLRTGDPRLSVEHPPLMNLWNALPLVFLNPKLPLDSPAWQTGMTDDFSDAFLWQANPDQAIRMVLLGRLPIIALGILLGAIVFRWTRDLFGVHAGLLTLALYAFDPNLIAHSRLSTTDLGLTVCILVAMWRWWAWLEKPTRWNLIWTGAAAGAAMATKFNGSIAVAMCVLVALTHPISSLRRGHYWNAIIRRLAALAVVTLVALWVVWAVYGFEVRGGVPAATYWRGIAKIWSEYTPGLPTFLMGQVAQTGWWYYFPVTFVLKTPLPTQILFALGIVLTIAQPGHAWRRVSAALIPPAVSMTAVLFSPLAFGYRHILPVLPFVLIVAGSAVRPKYQIPNKVGGGWRVVGIVLLLAWQIISVTLVFPHHLSYFNELAGGPLNGDRFLVDSNLDWGQDLPALKAQMDTLGLERVNLSYYGTALPAVYGVRYWPLPAFLHFVTGLEVDSFNPYTPEPGWYAISVTSLRMGLLYHATDLFAFFRDQTPAARAGYSIRLYKVEYPPDTPVDRAVVIGTPTYALPPQTLGVTPGHRLLVKWADNPDVFILAMSGPARYIATDLLPFDRDLRRAFRSAARSEGDALVVDARPLVESRRAGWRAPLRLPDGKSLDSPADFDGKLALIGYRLDSSTVAPGDALDLTTYWQVTGELVPPIAFFAHVTDDGQRIVGQYDGWGTALRGLEIGDVIAQRVRVPIRPDTTSGTYDVQVGVYSPDTMARWPLRLPSGATVDRVLLSPVQITAR